MALVSSTVTQFPRHAVRVVRLPKEHQEQLTPLQEHQLALRWRNRGDVAALHRLIVAYQPLVKRIAAQFRTSGVPFEDLVQEGSVGLTTAVRRFDPHRNVRVGTYAAYWIRACILELVLANAGPVRVGTSHRQRRILFGLGRARKLLEAHDEPTDCGHLAQVLDVDAHEVEAMMARLSATDVALDEKRHDGRAPDDRACLATESEDPEALVALAEHHTLRRERLAQGLECLTERERTIVAQRYLQQPAATLARLGVQYRISQERIRQIERAALDKLRRSLAYEGEDLAA